MPLALRQFSLFACALATVAACAAVFGYLSGTLAPIAVAAGLHGMSIPTAVSILLLAGSVGSTTLAHETPARRLAAAAASIGIVVLASYAVFGSDVISTALQRELFSSSLSNAGRTSPATALSILLIAAACWFRRRRCGLADLLAGATIVVCGIALMGYAYGVADLYRIPVFNSMAVNTAASLFALALAVMASDPSTGWARVIAHRPDRGEAYARRLLGFVALAPIVGGVLVKATGSGWIGFGAAMAILVAALAVPLAWLALRDGSVRMALDEERRRRIELQASLSTELERRLAEKVGELEREVAERAKAEEIAHRSQRMEAIGRLTGGIAHDFNNLLQALSGNVTIIQRGLPEGDKLRKFADNAEKAVRKGAKLTGQLLAFSRSQRLALRPILLRAAIQEARELIGGSLGPDVLIEAVEPSEPLWALGDAQQLELSLVNLALNARDAMPHGGRLHISAGETEPPQGKDEGRFVCVRVADEGEGMSPDVVSRAGEPFFTTKAQGKGTGLGLAQVYGFARQCGGDVRITSTLGRGTVVEIVLPWVEPGVEVPPLVPASAGIAERGRGRRVAVIDDDEAVRAVLIRGLADAGFDVGEASDGLTGLALIGARLPEVAVIDFMMPGMNGAEVARRAQIAQPGLPIVFVSGYSDTLALDGIAGATVLRKPFDAEALLAAVERALGG